jgi:glycosyltransferase involved in cell wall biosynthesis
MKKVLVITYYWPPSGGSGVQRWLKFVKYFRDFGIEPVILTVDPAYATFPAQDYSLEKEIPLGVEIIKTKASGPFGLYKKIRGKKIPQSGFAGEAKPNFLERIMRFIRGNFFIPDARIGWNKFAIKAALEIIQKYQIDCVITTSPPHSTQLIGLELKKKFNIQWISDLRDPWTDIYYNKELFRTLWAKKRDSKFETLCLKHADQLVVVSDSIARLFEKKNPIVSSKISVIPNGFDESDFENAETLNTEINYISYIGNLGPNYPIEAFLIEFRIFVKNQPNWKLRFVGNVFEEVKTSIKNLNILDYVEFIPYVEHAKAIEFMLNSKALLLIIPNTKENEGILTGKIFEYMASKKPIIFIGPEKGNAAMILKNTSIVSINSYNQMTSLEEFFKTPIGSINETEIQKFSRKELTKAMVALIDKSF